MSAIQNIFSRLAHVARNSELLQQHAAVLSRSGNRPIGHSAGYNQYTACHYSTDKPSAHAEMVAITKFRRYYQARNANDAKIRRKLKKTSIIVVRRKLADTNDDSCNHLPQLKGSAPCYHCTALLKDYGIKKVIFSTDCGEPQREKDKQMWRRMQI